jgi:tetratricopeptide (TPR) repeat protein
LNPPFYDAYVTLGSTEYLVANLNFIFRLFVRFENIKGNRQKAIENLKLAIDQGRYYQPYAKILLTVVYLREKRVDDALTIMKELERDFPENPLFKKEAALLAEKAATKKLPGKSR